MLRQTLRLAVAFLFFHAPSAYAQSASEIAGVAVGAALMGGACALAATQRDDDSAYLGLGGTYAIEDFRNTGAASIDDSLGINARIGYHCHPRFSTEVQFDWAEGFDGSGEIYGVHFSGRARGWTLTGNGKVHLLTGRIQPFLLAGLGVMEVEAQATAPVFGSVAEEALVFRFGGGFDLYATDHIAVSIDGAYVLPVGDLRDLNAISIGWGLQYRF